MIKRKPLIIGNDVRTGKSAWVREADRAIHAHVIGASGKGKSKLLEHMMRHDLRNRNGFILIDPHGDLYRDMLNYCVRMRYYDRVILIDPNDTDWSVGLNYLERTSQFEPAVWAEWVMRGIAKAFGDEHHEKMPELSRWLKTTLQTLVHNQGSMFDSYPLLDLDDVSVRHYLANQTNDQYLLDEWRSFTQATKRRQDELRSPVLNRMRMFLDSNVMRNITSQDKSTVDFRKAMDEGKAILCNLSPGKISSMGSRLLSVMLIDKVLQAGFSRQDIPIHKRRRFYCYLDEFEDYVCDDIARALKGLRKFGLSFILAHQEATPLKEQNLKVFSAVMANTDIKIAFAIQREDAEIMAKEMFRLDLDIVKDVIEQTKFWPIETTRTILSRGGTNSQGGGWGESEGTGSSAGFSTTMRYDPGGNLFYPEVLGMSESESRVTSNSSGRSNFENWSESESWNETDVPFYEFEPFKEVSSRTWRSTEEIKERFITWLKEQEVRRAHFLIRGRLKSPLPILTEKVEEIRVRDKDVEEFKERLYTQYALPAATAAKQIETRRVELLKLARNRSLEDIEFGE